MIRKNKIIVLQLLLALGFLFILFDGSLEASNNKFVVSADQANIHLNPDASSPVIETLEKGEYLNLASPRKFRKVWNYVYFSSKKNGKTKSGYVHDSEVEKIFRSTKSREIGVREQSSRNTANSSSQETQWGMSIDQVLELEGKPAVRETSDGMEIIGYQKKVIDKNCLVGYLFLENRLFKTQYNFVEHHVDKSQYLTDYAKVKTLVAQKYGEPEQEAIDWKDSQYRNDATNWGTALSLGHVEYHSHWNTSESEVILSLFKVKDDVIMRIEYSGKRISD